MNIAPQAQGRTPSFAERISEHRAGPCRLIMLPTLVTNVVTWCGSFHSAPDMGNKEELLQHLVVSMLDKGAGTLDRFALAEILENKGAELAFSSDILRIDFSGRTLKKDVAEVLGLTALQLQEPLLAEEELAKAKDRISASVKRSMESTSAQASGALRRRIYGVSHPNYMQEFEEQLEQLQQLSIDDVRAYHAAHFGANACTLVVVGDVDESAVSEAVENHFAGWPSHSASPHFAETSEQRAPGSSTVVLPDKENVDVRLGHALAIRRNDPCYIPAFLANFALGGNFSARLMQTIRDEMGLTYGVGSSLSGVSAEYDGHWQVAVTLSREYVERGIEETVKQIRRFVEGGVTPEELLEKKTTVTGAFKVGLSTTFGLAKTLLGNVEQGFEIAYLDEFPDRVESVSVDEVNSAIAQVFVPEAMHVTLAGNVREKDVDQSILKVLT